MAPHDRLTVDDVLSAHEFLRDYEGDMHGLLAGSVREPERFAEWRLTALCPDHGEISQVVSRAFTQAPSSYEFVICRSCERDEGQARRFAATSVIRVEEGTGKT